MSIGLTGENLVFVISQPRAGSTMLQRILACHPDIHTVSEPWLMLPLLRVLTGRGHQDGPEARFIRENVQAFLGTFPDSRAEYVAAVRGFSSRLYSQALAAAGKRRFLDKTPRYAYCIPELFETFPDAKFIVLLRNPVAVMCSVVQTWTGYDPGLLTSGAHRDDLLLVPGLLVEGIRMLGPKALTVRYETLVAEPEPEVRRICDYLGTAFSPDMIEYSTHDLPKWQFGDHKVYEHSRPEASKAGGWKTALRDPRMWLLADEYVRRLGPVVVEQMGYSAHELSEALRAAQPGGAARWWHGSGFGRASERVRRFAAKPWPEKTAAIRRRLGGGPAGRSPEQTGERR